MPAVTGFLLMLAHATREGKIERGNLLLGAKVRDRKK
jgi:hypothetical protein